MRFHLVALAAAALVFASPAHPATLPATAADVGKVLATAQSGDVVKLVGEFPDQVRLGRRTFNPPLTIDATAATVKGLFYFSAVEGITFRGGTWATIRVDNGKTITVEKARFAGPDQADGYGVFINGGANVRVIESAFSQYKSAVVLGKVDGFEVLKNGFDRMRSDGVNIAQSWRGRVAENIIHGTRITSEEHPDCIQMWSRPDAPPASDVVIEDNECVGNTQGFTGFNHVRNGVNDGGFDRITIRRNRVTGTYPHGIALSEGRNSTVTDNVVATYPTSRYRASINVGDAFKCGNVVKPGAGKAGITDPAC
jgi:hypothetical protein